MEFSTNLRRQILNKDCRNLLDNLVNADIEDATKDTYIGVVVNNNDPLKKGRCRVRVYNLFPANIPDTDIPWAIPDFSYMGSTKGAFIVPPVNTKVRVYFDRYDIYCPIYEAKGFNQNDLPAGITTNYPDTMILYSTDQGEYYSVNRVTRETKLKLAGKIAIGNETVEVLDVITQLMDLLLSSVTATSIGPQPLSSCIGGPSSLVGVLKAKLNAIKGTI